MISTICKRYLLKQFNILLANHMALHVYLSNTLTSKMIPIIKTWPTCVYKTWLTSLFPEKFVGGRIFDYDCSTQQLVMEPYVNSICAMSKISCLLKPSSYSGLVLLVLTYVWSCAVSHAFYDVLMRDVYVVNTSQFNVSACNIDYFASRSWL